MQNNSVPTASLRIRRGFNRLAFVVFVGFALAALIAAIFEIGQPSGSLYADFATVNSLKGSSFAFHSVNDSEYMAVDEMLSRPSASKFTFKDGRVFKAISLIGISLEQTDFDDINKTVANAEARNLDTIGNVRPYAINSIAFRCESNCYALSDGNSGSHLRRQLSFGFQLIILAVGLAISGAIEVLSYVIRGFLL